MATLPPCKRVISDRDFAGDRLGGARSLLYQDKAMDIGLLQEKPRAVLGPGFPLCSNVLTSLADREL